MKKITLVFAVFLFAACQSGVDTMRTLTLADSLMSTLPDSALVVLEGLKYEKISIREYRAYHALLLSQAYDKNYIDIDSDSLIRIAHSYYTKRGRDIRKHALSCYYLGQVQVNASEFEAATVSFLDAIKYAEQVEDHYTLGMAHRQLAMVYDDQELFSQAIDHHRQALDNYTLADLPLHRIYSLIQIGKVYKCEQNLPEALSYYAMAENLAVEIGDSTYLMDIARSISSTYFLMDSIKTAKNVLLNSYKIYNNGTVPNRYSDLFLLGAIYSKEGKNDSARYYLNISQQDDIPYNVAAVEYELYTLDLNENKLNSAIEHLKKHYTTLDSIHYAAQQNQIFEIEKKYQTTQLEYENYKHRTTIRYTFIGITLILAIIIVTSFMLYRRHKNIIKSRDKQITEYLLALSEADNSMNSILNTQSEQENKLKELLEKRFSILSRYYEIAYCWQTRPEAMAKKVAELISLESIESDTFSILRNVIEERYSGLIEALKKSRYDLSENDINLLCLIACGFSTQQMCAVYNASSLQTIYTKKYRLALKLNLQQGETLDAFVKTLVGNI